MKFRKTCIGTVLLLLLAVGVISITQGAPVGTEFQVNTYTPDRQFLPSVAMDEDGDFVITWQSEGQDGDGWGIYAQRYDSSGEPVGIEFQVNTYWVDHQYGPSVAMDADGDFVITWFSLDQPDPWGGVYAQRYDKDGNPVGTEFKVNTYFYGYPSNPKVAMDADGDFVITWMSEGQDGDKRGIFAQLYDSSGDPVGTEFQVNTYWIGIQWFPRVAMDADGDFVITWESIYQDDSESGVYAQRYDKDGNPVGTEFQVNTFWQWNQYGPSVAMDANGDFVIAWHSQYQQYSVFRVYAQRYDKDGNPVGTEFQVNTFSTVGTMQMAPSVAMDKDGNSVITWISFYQDGDGWGIYAQLYDSSGDSVGTEFQVNTYTTGSQYGPSVAMDEDGDFIIAWQSDDQDGDSLGIYAQRFIKLDYVIDEIADTIDNKGVASSLTYMLSKALDALNHGNMEAFDRIIAAFIWQVTVLSGKQIDTEYASTLIDFAEAWLENSSQV